MSQRNTSISIAKGIAIILMVVGHAECPGALMSLIYLFHMPLFFITAGYFFTRAHADEPWQFCAKRFKGLYVPFVKWSIFFLLIHNLMFSWGILNEIYGNWSGGVTHPYTFQQGLQRAVNIVFSMGSYDEFLAGAFWFFRALLITSILFLILYRLLDNRGKSQTGWQAAALICLGALGFAALKINYGLRVSIVQGGIRETWGMFFFGFGVIFRILEQRIGTNVRSPWFWATIIACLAVLAVGTHEHWAGMNLSPKMRDVATLPLTGIAGFFVTYQLSRLIDRRQSFVKRALVYCGEMSLYIYIFHIVSFKAVSLIKIWWYDLDFAQIGCHMVIHDHPNDGFWLLYSLAGVGLPLLWMWAYRKLRPARKSKF